MTRILRLCASPRMVASGMIVSLLTSCGTPPEEHSCGNGVLEPGEACDDGYSDACGTCNADCSGSRTRPIADLGACPEYAAVAEIARAYCSVSLTCDEERGTRGYSSLEACVETVLQRRYCPLNQYEPAVVTVTSRETQDCLDELSRTSCGELFTLEYPPFACRTVLSSDREAGESCHRMRFGDDCGLNESCKADSCGCRSCVPLPREGEGCQGPCAYGLLCNDAGVCSAYAADPGGADGMRCACTGTRLPDCGVVAFCASGYCDYGTGLCAPPAPLGSSCSYHYDCSPNVCIGGICELRRLEGETCVPGGCAHDLECIAGYCARVDRCQLRRVGEVCSYVDRCESDSYCEFDGARGDSFCLPKRGVGESCGDCLDCCDRQTYCAGSATRTCTPRSAAGESCTDPSACEPGLFCFIDEGSTTGTCVLDNTGGRCLWNEWCSSGWCRALSEQSQCATDNLGGFCLADADCSSGYCGDDNICRAAPVCQ